MTKLPVKRGVTDHRVGAGLCMVDSDPPGVGEASTEAIALLTPGPIKSPFSLCYL